MSTDYESVVSPSLGPEAVPHPLSLPSNGMHNERHPLSGISYEGRVSVIPPLNNYEGSLGNSFGRQHSLQNARLHSPPFSSPQNLNFMSSNSMSYHIGSNSRRSPAFPFNIHSTPGTSRDFENYDPFRANEENFLIKQEGVDMSMLKYPADLPKTSPERTETEDASRMAPSTNGSSVETNNDKTTPHTQDHVKETGLSSSALTAEAEKDCASNAENTSEPGSPFLFQENYDRGPGSVESDQQDSRETELDPMSFMNSSFDGIQEIFHGENSKSLKCQFCSYSTDSKEQFGSHVNSHFDHKCMKCDATMSTMEQLKDHLQQDHQLTAEDVEDLQNTRIPRVNSQGKVKTFKCKACEYRAITKADFWKHAKKHIRAEKQLSCKKCAFVTEYKHHLEYHMRNHLGSKPYKCNKCSYSCVNKSMLNSHMKSHSNIYQYRCADCSYATKYCHSLKLHLRKYSHTPAMVLNPDGTPNPVPIIDIYGTRRGPKLKKDENGMPILPPQYQVQAQFMRAHMEVTGNIPPAPTAPQEKLSANKPGAPGMHLPLPQSPFQNPFSFPANIQNYPSFIPHEFKETHKENKDIEEAANEFTEKEETLNMSKSPEVQESFKCELCNFATQSKDILSHHLLLHARDNEEAEMRRASLASHLNEANDGSLYGARRESTSCSPSFQREQSKPAPHPFPSQLPGAPNSIQEYLVRTMNPMMFNPMIGNPGSFTSAMELQQRIHHLMYRSSKEQAILAAKEKSLSLSPIKLNSSPQTEVVLDLSKEQTPPNAVSSSQPHSSSSSPSFLPASPPNSDISTPPSKSRRKGRAFKLERIALRLSGSGEEGESSCNEGGETQKEQDKATKGNQVPPLLPLDLPEAKENESSSLKGKWEDAYQCQYCDIAFKDVVMYTMHMGYHGFKNPFICNMCGFDAEEKVPFFLHIGRYSHL